MRRGKQKPEDYNRAVVARLESISPAHAAELNSRGIWLGWWNTCDYCRLSGLSPEEAAKKIAAAEIPPG